MAISRIINQYVMEIRTASPKATADEEPGKVA